MRISDWSSDVCSSDLLGAAAKLESFRRLDNSLRDLSFTTISGAGPNGAVVHYRVTAETNRKLEQGTLYLVDSGGQYPDRSEEHTSELQSLMRISYAVFCLKKKTTAHIAVQR